MIDSNLAAATGADIRDIYTTAGKLADCRHRREATMLPSGEAAKEKVDAKGKLTARVRITALLDEGSFVELDALARHRSVNFVMADKRAFGDGNQVTLPPKKHGNIPL